MSGSGRGRPAGEAGAGEEPPVGRRRPPDPSGGPVLRVRGLTRRFGDEAAVDGLDLEIATGEYFCILGPSGCGKTTFLRLVAGFEEPDAGTIELGGGPVAGLPPERRDVNLVFQDYALFPHMSVRDNVAFGLRMKGRSRDEVDARVDRMLELMGLEGYGKRAPGALSGGERQRVALARAVVNRPSLLLLDEPLGALDRSLRERMQRELRRIQREVGIAFVHVTHDQVEAQRLADRVAIMRAGRFLQVGPPPDLYARPGSAFVADFLGPANLFRARTEATVPPVVVLGDGAGRLRLPPGFDIPPRGSEGRYGVRPEALELAGPEEDAGGRGGAILEGRLRERRVLGPVAECVVEVGSLLFDVEVRGADVARLPEPGEPLRLRVPGEAVFRVADGEEEP